MLSIDSIERGVVIDHITSGKAMTIYNYLNLGALDCSVAIIKNVKSQKHGKKDIIKVEDRIDLDLDALGYIDPDATVNIVESGKITRKYPLSLPHNISNVIKCKNPRCICSIEKEIVHMFRLYDAEKRTYRCVYCEHEQN